MKTSAAKVWKIDYNTTPEGVCCKSMAAALAAIAEDDDMIWCGGSEKAGVIHFCPWCGDRVEWGDGE